MASEWTLEPGQQIKRVELHEQFGGRRYGGIGPSSQSPNVFVFSDPVGQLHGYSDGWHEGLFHYTGEGQKGDQTFDHGNKAILNHGEDGRTLRVFDGAGGMVTYVDEFEVDDAEPFYRADAPETGEGEIREVIVFRLRPVSISPKVANPKLDEIFNGPTNAQIPIEKQMTEKFYVAPNKEPYKAERNEQRLVLAFETHLTSLGHEIWRNKILPPGEARPILTDLFDGTTGTLVEAKGSVERGAIRMAIGQLADYRRFVEEDLRHLAVLVPRAPRKDLCELLALQGIEFIFPVEGGFADSTGGALTDP